MKLEMKLARRILSLVALPLAAAAVSHAPAAHPQGSKEPDRIGSNHALTRPL